VEYLWGILLTSSLDDLSWRGGVAGDAWLSRSGRTLLVLVPGVPNPVPSAPTPLLPPPPPPPPPRFCVGTYSTDLVYQMNPKFTNNCNELLER